MIKIGITGGIGSGKTIVSKLFELSGIPIYYADLEAKRITENSGEIKTQLTKLFGEDLYSGNTLNKKRFASIIFNDPRALQQAENIIHPKVREDFKQWADRQNKPIAGIEAAILFESGFDRDVDQIITVTAPIDIRIARVMNRDNTTKEKVLERISNQLSDQEKIKRSDYIIINDDRKPVIPQVPKILEKLNYSFSAK